MELEFKTKDGQFWFEITERALGDFEMKWRKRYICIQLED